MALGVPLKFGEEGAEKELPWLVLEMVIADKGVSWDWLLTGRNTPAGSGAATPDGKGDKEEEPLTKNPAPPISKLTRAKMPRIETRELRRALLNGGTRIRPAAIPDPLSTQPNEAPETNAAESYNTQPDASESIEPDMANIRSQARIQSEILARTQPSDAANRKQEDAVVHELEEIKAAMQTELRRVEKILRERQG